MEDDRDYEYENGQKFQLANLQLVNEGARGEESLKAFVVICLQAYPRPFDE